jgi:hypothetical protein
MAEVVSWWSPARNGIRDQGSGIRGTNDLAPYFIRALSPLCLVAPYPFPSILPERIGGTPQEPGWLERSQGVRSP